MSNYRMSHQVTALLEYIDISYACFALVGLIDFFISGNNFISDRICENFPYWHIIHCSIEHS